MVKEFSQIDQRFMAACLRYARRHRGLTGTNPSVGTMLVSSDGLIISCGVTAKGGRPHAETIALRNAGKQAKGATAYVSLEPCAHHGVTPPCARALIDAGVARVVTAWVDPDSRVDGKGHAMLEAANIEVETGCCNSTASADLSGYLNRKINNRPQVILKLAVSADGMLGKTGQEVAITGPQAKAYGHRLRAEVDGILVGHGTVLADDPDLTCRLPGLQRRSPTRFILDSRAELSTTSRLAKSAGKVPVICISSASELPEMLGEMGVKHMAAESHQGQLALPEILDDMANAGHSSLLVEGGAQVAQSFLDANLVDEIALFTSDFVVGENGLKSPVSRDVMPKGFQLFRQLKLGDDQLGLYRRKQD